MKKLNKKWIIILSILLVVVIITASIFIIKNKKQQIQTKENTYEAIVSINPMIKLEFKEVCHKSASNGNFESYSCDEPKVTNYELINDDAKNIYDDLDFSSTNGCLADVLVMLAKKARENGIVFDSVHVSSNWESLKDYKNNNELLNTSNFEIDIVNKEELKNQENQKFLVTFNSDGGSSVDSQEILKGNKVSVPISPTKEGYSFVEWQFNGTAYDFNNKVESNIELKAIWKKEDTSNNQNNNSNSTDNSQNNKPTTDNTTPKNDNNTTPKDEPTEQPKTSYDLNLNDNIMYTFVSIPIYERPSSTCIAQIREAGYLYYDDALVAISFKADQDNDYYDIDLIEKFPSCFNPVPQSTINELKKIKGIKVVTNNYLYAVDFSEYAYRKYAPDIYSNAKRLGIMSYGGFGNNDYELLTEQACQEYNLSCGRW